MFVKDDYVEAVDECGRWERAIVLEVKSAGFRVSFIGWGKRHDRWATPAEVREPTETERDGGRGKRRLPTRAEQAISKAMARLTAGDHVNIASNGERSYFEAEVVEVDKFKSQLKVINLEEGEADDPPTVVSSNQLYLNEEEKEEPTKRQCKRKTPNRTMDAEQQMVESSTQTETETKKSEAKCVTEYMTLNKSGLVIEGGGVYQVTDSPVVFGVESVNKESASGTLIVNSKIYSDVKISAPVNKLLSVASTLSRKDSAYMRQFSVLSHGDDLQREPASVRQSVRKTLLGKTLRKKVQSALRSASFRKSFCLGVLSPEFDLKIFNFKDDLKVEYSYFKHNMSYLDSLLGEGWDLQSPSGQCNFVTKLTLKVKDLQLFGKVFTARCRETLPKNYRSFLSEYDVGQTGSGLSEVIAMV